MNNKKLFLIDERIGPHLSSTFYIGVIGERLYKGLSLSG